MFCFFFGFFFFFFFFFFWGGGGGGGRGGGGIGHLDPANKVLAHTRYKTSGCGSSGEPYLLRIHFSVVE